MDRRRTRHRGAVQREREDATMRPMVIEVSGGVVAQVFGCDDYIVVDRDTGEELPELPEGYAYDDDGDIVERVK